MNRMSLRKHLGLVAQGATLEEAVVSLANDPELNDKQRALITRDIEAGKPARNIFRDIAMSMPAQAPTPLEPASTERAGGLGETVSTLTSPEYGKGVWGQVGDMALHTGIPLATAVLATPVVGPFGAALLSAGVSQLVRSGERAYEGKQPAFQKEDIARGAFDTLTGLTGIKVGNLGAAGADTIKRGLATMLFGTGAAGAGAEMENLLAPKEQRQPIGRAGLSAVTDPLTLAMNFLGATVAAGHGGKQPAQLESPLTPAEQAFMDAYNKDAAVKGKPLATPEQTREAINAMNAVKDTTIGGDIKNNPLTAYGLVDKLKASLEPMRQVLPEVAQQSLSNIPPAQRTATSLQNKPINMSEFSGTPTNVELTPTLQRLGRTAPLAAEETLSRAVEPTDTVLNQLEPGEAYATGRAKMQETAEGLGREQAAKQAELEAYKTSLGQEQQQAKVSRLQQEVQALSAQADEALARYEAAIQAAESAGPEARTAAMQKAAAEKQVLDQAEAAYEQAKIGLEMDDTVFKLRQREKTRQAEQGIEQQYQQEKPSPEQYQQFGKDVQEVVGGTPKAVKTGASIVYEKALNEIEAKYGGQSANVPPQMVTPDLIQTLFAKNISNSLKEKLGLYAEGKASQPITVSEVMEIYRAMNQRSPGAGASPKAQRDFGLLMEGMRNMLSRVDPELGAQFGVMNKDYATSANAATNIREAGGGGMTNPYQAARVGEAYTKAPSTSPRGQLMESPMMGVVKDQATGLREQMRQAKAKREQAQFDMEQRNLAESRGQAISKQRGLQQAKKEAMQPYEQFKQEQILTEAERQAFNQAQVEVGRQQQAATGLLEKINDKRAAAQAQNEAMEMDRKIKLAESTTREEVDGLKQLQSDIAEVINAPKKSVGTDPASRAELAEMTRRVKESADTAVEAGIITPEERAELLKATAKSIIEQTAVSRLPASGMGVKKDMRQLEGTAIPKEALNLLDNKLARALKSTAPIDKGTLKLFEKIMEVSKNTNRPQDLLDFFGRNFADVEAGGVAAFDKLETAFNNARKSPSDPTLSTLMSEVLNKVLVTGPDGGVDFKHAAETWASLPDSLKKRVYGNSFEFMDKINRNLFPTLAVADKFIRTNRIYSWISSFRSYLSSASYLSKFGVGGGLGLAGYAGAGGLGAVGTLSVPLIAMMLAKVPQYFLNSVVRQGIKQAPVSGAAAAGGMVGGKQYERK